MNQSNTRVHALMASILAPLACVVVPAVDAIDDRRNETDAVTRVALAVSPRLGTAEVEDGIAAKGADVAVAFAAEGEPIGDFVDVDVTFPLTVE